MACMPHGTSQVIYMYTYAEYLNTCSWNNFDSMSQRGKYNMQDNTRKGAGNMYGKFPNESKWQNK